MIKKISSILLPMLLLFTICFSSFAQTKVKRFCEVTVAAKSGLTSKTIATLSIGKIDSLFLSKNSSELIELNKINDFKTSVDVLNYMNNLGWTLVAIILNASEERIYFEKEFNTSELATQNN